LVAKLLLAYALHVLPVVPALLVKRIAFTLDLLLLLTLPDLCSTVVIVPTAIIAIVPRAIIIVVLSLR